MDTFLAEVQITIPAIEVLSIISTSHEEIFALIALMEWTHRSSLVYQWTVVLRTKYCSVFREYSFPIKALGVHFLSDRQLLHPIAIHVGQNLINSSLHLFNLITLCLYNLLVLRQPKLHRYHAVMLIGCYNWSGDPTKSTLLTDNCDFIALGKMLLPFCTWIGGIAASYSAGHRKV